MIKCSRVDGETVIEVEGRVTAVAADLCEIIAAVYRALQPGVRSVFKAAIVIAVAAKNTPMWELDPESVKSAECVVVDLTTAKRQAEKMERRDDEHEEGS